MTEWVEQWICIKFWVKLEHSSAETVWIIQKAAAMGNWWLEASSWQCAHTCIMSHAEFLGETSNHPGDSALLQPRFGAQQVLVFPKTKITFEREQISDHNEIQENTTGQLIVIPTKDFAVFWTVEERLGELWGPNVPTLKGTEASLSYIQCFVYLLQYMFLFFIVHGWILAGQTLYILKIFEHKSQIYMLHGTACSKTGLWKWLHKSVNLLTITELYV